MMAAVEDELDFSSYLVDIDDDEGGLDSATDTTNAAFAASSLYMPPASLLSSSAASSAFSPSSASTSASGRPFQAVQTHSAKNWPAGIVQQHTAAGSISPSPTESASESSYKASTISSTAGTAPSSIASSSYPDSASSWGTQKTFVNPRKSHTSTPSTSLSSAASLDRSSAHAAPHRASFITIPSDTTPPASALNGTATTQSPAMNLSFNYDFAHNPAHGTALSPSSAFTQTQPSTSYANNDAHDSTQYSASLPSSSRPTGFSSRHGSSDKLSSMDSHNSLGKPMSPSSGPQHVSKGHRNRQASASTASLSTSFGSSSASSHWLSMTSSTPSIAIPQFASTPYSRPVPPSNDSSSLLGTSQQSSTGAGALNKKPSKRKNTVPNSSTNTTQAQAQLGSRPVQNQSRQYAINTTTNLSNGNAPGMQQFGFPIPTPAYRDPASVIASPISPSLDSFPSFANFMPQTAPHSTVTSPTDQSNIPTITSKPGSRNNSSASTPNDAILSAVTAPSPFDPRNFGLSTFDPLSDDFNAILANLGASSSSQSPASAAASQSAVEVNKAAALAGVGGKWMNWTNSQEGNPELDATLISNVLAKAPDVPTTAGPSASGATAKQANRKDTAKSPAPFDLFPTRESSVVPSGFGDIDGESPEDLAARDPLATHLWRLYAKAKAGLPNGARMENITWRMMGLKLNKQKADAVAAGLGAVPPPVESTSNDKRNDTVQEEVEERGRKGRSTAPNSASPGESGDFVEMDWRQQSRSRSRVPQAIAGGMDWRAQSRSRSRAPGMRLSMPSGPQGFHLPTYADIVETMASVSRAPQDVSTAASASTHQQVEPSGQAYGNHSRQASQTQVDLQSFERTLKQYIADAEVTKDDSRAAYDDSRGNANEAASKQQDRHPESSALSYSYVPPAPLPVSASSGRKQATEGQGDNSSLSTSMPQYPHILLQQASQIQPAISGAQDMSSASNAPISAENAISQSQNSISASVEAYLSSLEHTPSVIDLPPHRHVGSIPGLFNEQDLKANHHADYGFLPKLVRKTSFDASYPAQLAQENQKLGQKKRSIQQQQQHSHLAQQQTQQQPAPTMPYAQNTLQQEDQQLSQSWTDSNNLFLMDNINNYLRGAAQSVPTTPSVATANIPFNFFANPANVGPLPSLTPYAGASPDMSQQAQLLAQAQAQLQAQTAAVEAFRRLQTAQALQAAAQHNQQQQQAYTPYLMEAAYSPGSLPPELLAAMSPGQYANFGMHVNPSQTQHMQYPSNALARFGEPTGAPWPASPPSSQTSPAGQHASPDDHAAAASEDRLRSAATSRSSSFTNIPSLLSHSFTAAEPAQGSNTQTVEEKKSHSRQQSTAVSSNNVGENSGPPTICVNCKTTNTPLWRRDENGQPLCNACQLFRKLHGSDRPVSLHNSVVKKRNRTRNKEAPKKSTSRSQRRNSTTSSAMPAKTPEDSTPEDV